MRWYYAVISLGYLLFSILLFKFFQHKPEPNRCDMTVMYRNMYFMQLKLQTLDAKEAKQSKDPALRYSFSSDFRHYSTVLYGEAEYAVDFSSWGRVTGIPVLFVPGNAGSFRQVRSLGSLLQNKTESRHTPFHFNVFAVDFNEELSGIAGMYLERQIRYLKYVVDHIWSMYDPPAHGLILVGHSMGGIVVRSLLRHSDFDVSKIALIITLGTPHRSPPIIFDSYLEKAYEQMHLAWQKRGREVPMVSISGGLKDTLVPEHLSTEHGFYHFSTTAIDGVEAEADHLCIVWCNQLVRHTSRLLFEYAATPRNFSKNFDDLVSRLYKSNGNLYTEPSEAEMKLPLLVRNELTIVKNKRNISCISLLRAEGNDAVFVLFSKGSSWLLNHGKQYPLNNLENFQYAYLPSINLPNKFGIVLGAHHTLKAIAVTQQTLQKQFLSIDAFIIAKGFLAHLWKAELDGEKLAAVIPLKIAYPWIALEGRLRLLNCIGKKKGISRIEFVSRGIRRLSYELTQDKTETVVGYNLHSNEIEGRFIFILDTGCRYEALINIDFPNTLILVLQRHAYVLGFCVVVYALCSLFASALVCSEIYFVNCSWKHCSKNAFCYSLTCFLYTTIIIITKKTDRFFTMLSAVGLFLLLYLVNKVIVYNIITLSKIVRFRLITRTFPKLFMYILLPFCIYQNYANNGFFALTGLLIVSLTECHWRFASCHKVDECSLITSITLLHFIAFILFLPFGICSIWNLSHYGVVNAYEDPTRMASYVAVLILLFRLFTNARIPGLIYAVSIALFFILLVKTEPLLCLTRLGTYLIFVVFLFPLFLITQGCYQPSKLTGAS